MYSFDYVKEFDPVVAKAMDDELQDREAISSLSLLRTL